MCNRCNGKYLMCSSKAKANKVSKTYDGYEPNFWCDNCEGFANKAYWIKLSCSSCHFFSKEEWWPTSYGYIYPNTVCTKASCFSALKRRLDDPEDDTSINHLYVDSSGNLTPIECAHGLSVGQHGYDCEAHSSYGDEIHYYCAVHGYVGTSATCPGLAVTPSPSSLTLYYGQSETIAANQQPSEAAVAFETGDSSIADVNSDGNCVATGFGSTTIKVTATL